MGSILDRILDDLNGEILPPLNTASCSIDGMTYIRTMFIVVKGFLLVTELNKHDCFCWVLNQLTHCDELSVPFGGQLRELKDDVFLVLLHLLVLPHKHNLQSCLYGI